jgi:molybdopterin-guanine dinucleotide biosynthesis protein B
MHENTNNSELSLNDLINVLDPLDCDIILVEGFKEEKFPKIELYREEIGKGLLHTSDESIIAIATDSKLEINKDIKILDINNPQEIVDFIIKYLNITK